MHVGEIWIYPVKSLGGCSLPFCALDALGFEDDRRFMIVDPSGRFVTQRTVPRMALIRTELTATALVLTAAGYTKLRVPRVPDDAGTTSEVTIWSDAGLVANDCGDEAAGWLSDYLHQRCRLVRVGARFRRTLRSNGNVNDEVGFADAYPFLVVSDASLHNLNDRLVERGVDTVPMNRFRPNIVVHGAAGAFVEDTWERFKIGDLTFRSAGPCARCVVTTTDQSTAERGPEPLRTLSSYRRDPGDPSQVNFGQNVIHESKAGTVRVGDPITIPK